MTPIEVWQNGVRINIIPVGSEFGSYTAARFESTPKGMKKLSATPHEVPVNIPNGGTVQIDENTILVAKGN